MNLSSINWSSFLKRFSEPSSWLAFAAALGSLGFSIPASLVQGVALVGAGFCVILGFILPEAK